MRLHRVRCARPLWSAEGGFALDRTGDATPAAHQDEGPGFALARYPAGFSGLRDLESRRVGRMLRVFPNTNLLVPRTVIPTLLGQHAPGEHWLACAVLADPDVTVMETTWSAPPSWPDSIVKRKA